MAMQKTHPFDVVSTVLHDIAPEIDLATIDEAVDFRTAADLDSIDFLNLVAGIHELTGIDIPERDYDSISTLQTLVAYLAVHL